jgi:hypothetical protein
VLFYVTIPIAVLGFLQALAVADPTVPVDPAKDPTGALDQLQTAISQRKWGLAGVIGTMLFVAFARFISPRIHGKFGAWVNSTRVSAALAILSGMGAAITMQLMKGGTFSLQLVVFGFGFGVAAIGGYNAFWDIFFPADKKPPSSTTSDSAAELAAKQPPSPPPPIRPGTLSMLLPLVFVLPLLNIGCAEVCANGFDATCGRKIVTGVDALDGFVARQAAKAQAACRASADALAVQPGKIEDARAAYNACVKTGTAISIGVKETQHAADVASDAIDVGEAAGQKDYGAVLNPLRDAVNALLKAAADAGIKNVPNLDALFGGKTS